VPPHDGPDETESEAVSGGAAASLETDEPVEDGLPIRFCNALAAIGYLERSATLGVLDPDLNFSAAGVF
jgi:hypothetical protein